MTLGRSIGIILLAGIVLLLILIWWITSQAQLYQSEYGPGLRREFHFNHGSPYIVVEGERKEVFTIYPKLGGLLYEAGFRDGDIIVSESITGFYKLLYHSRGRQASVDVVDGGDGPPLEERELRVITFNIPAAQPTN